MASGDKLDLVRVVTSTLHFNEEHYHKEDIPCSERCGHRNYYESPDRFFGCNHGLHFEHLADVIFNSENR